MHTCVLPENSPKFDRPPPSCFVELFRVVKVLLRPPPPSRILRTFSPPPLPPSVVSVAVSPSTFLRYPLILPVRGIYSRTTTTCTTRVSVVVWRRVFNDFPGSDRKSPFRISKNRRRVTKETGRQNNEANTIIMDDVQPSRNDRVYRVL